MIWLSLCSGILASSKHAQQPSLNLELTVEKFAPVEHEILVQLTMTNQGEHVIRLPYLKNGLIERYSGWSGWNITVHHEHYGVFGFRPMTKPTLKITELVALRPGGRLIVTVNVANTKQYDYEGIDKTLRPRLIEVPGEYTVYGSLRLYEGNTPFWYKFIGWSGSVESNRLKLVIEQPEQQQ